MENQGEVNVPLLDQRSTKRRKYLDAGFFDTILLFWVGKLVDVKNNALGSQM